MAQPTSDDNVLGRIQGLVHEEQQLYGHAALSDRHQVRLEKIQVELDQCWDLLRVVNSVRIPMPPRSGRHP